MSGETGEGGKREYRCQHTGCGGLVLVSALSHGVIEAAYCPKCHRRQTVYLGGRKTIAAGALQDAAPAIERGPVRDWRRGR